MTSAIILIVFGIFTIGVGLFVWALSRAAAQADASIDPSDCFSRYRLHVLGCADCNPPERRCPVGEGLRREARDTFTDKYMERRNREETHAGRA